MKQIYTVLNQIPQQPQSQAALEDQLHLLKVIANRFGLYDAADFIDPDKKTER